MMGFKAFSKDCVSEMLAAPCIHSSLYQGTSFAYVGLLCFQSHCLAAVNRVCRLHMFSAHFCVNRESLGDYL